MNRCRALIDRIKGIHKGYLHAVLHQLEIPAPVYKFLAPI